MQPTRKKSGRTTLYVATFCCIVAFGAILTQSILINDADASPQIRPRQAMQAPSKIKVGEFPPDFDLPMLKLGEDQAGNPVGIISDKQSWRLSSFRGKKPVCMIMSSYT